MPNILGAYTERNTGWPPRTPQRAMLKITLNNEEGTHIRPIGQEKEYWGDNNDMATIARIARQIAIAATHAGATQTHKIQSLVQRMVNTCYELPSGGTFQPRAVEAEGYKYQNV